MIDATTYALGQTVAVWAGWSVAAVTLVLTAYTWRERKVADDVAKPTYGKVPILARLQIWLWYGLVVGILSSVILYPLTQTAALYVILGLFGVFWIVTAMSISQHQAWDFNFWGGMFPPLRRRMGKTGVALSYVGFLFIAVELEALLFGFIARLTW